MPFINYRHAHPLHPLLYRNNRISYHKCLTEEPALYAFWLDNRQKLAHRLYRKVLIKGPVSAQDELICWDWQLDDEFILLYVGKTTNLKKRLSLHLKLKTYEWNRQDGTALHSCHTLNKRTTSCQLRAGVEHLLRSDNAKEKYGVNGFHQFLGKYLWVNWVGEANFINRFYAEDLAVGLGKPWFNVDSER